MARDYEVRQEYESHALGQLMDAPVTCFQGVGDVQAELLKQYFGLSSVKELAEFKFFVGALAIQELALGEGGQSATPVAMLAAKQELPFKVNEEYSNLTITELMNAPIHALADLTPAQDLALYDIFRITSIAHLAHNRIMLESRVIQVLNGKESARQGTSGATDEEVQTVMGRRATSSGASSAVQRITEGRRAAKDEQLARLADETTDHVRGRIESLRERAKEKAGDLGGREAAGSRLNTIRAGHERVEAGRSTAVSQARAASVEPSEGVRRSVSVASRRTSTVTTVARAGAGRASVGAARPAMGAGRVPAAAGRGAAGGGIDAEGRTAAVLAARGESKPTRAAAGSSRLAAVGAARSGVSQRFGPGAFRGGGGGGGGGGSSRASAVTTSTSTTTTSTTQEVVVAAAAPAAPPQQPARGGFQPWMAAAVLGLVLLVLVLWLAMRPAQQPAGTAQAPGQQAGTATTTAGTTAGTQPGAAPGTAAPSGAPSLPAGTAATATTQAKPSVAIKAEHEVKEGQSLWRISRVYYELGHVWRRIFEENQDQIQNPDLIYPKQKFRIPQ